MSAASERAWAALRADLAAFLRRRVPDEHAAEDLLQEVFLRIERSGAELRDEDRLTAWVYRIARNALADRGRAGPPPAPLEDVDPAAPENAEENLNAEVERWLRAMLSALPDETREAVRLADLEGLPQREIAERLGLSLSGAKSRVQRGRRQLRGVLQSCCRIDLDRHGNVRGYERHGSCEGCEPDATPADR